MKNMILDVNLLKSKYFISLAICSVSTLLINSCVKTKSFKEHSSLYNGKCDKIIRRQSNAKIQIDYFEEKRAFYPDLIYVNCNQDSFYVFFLEGNCITKPFDSNRKQNCFNRITGDSLTWNCGDIN